MPIRHVHYTEFPLLENSQTWGEVGGFGFACEGTLITRTVLKKKKKEKKNVDLVQILLKRRSQLKKVFTMSKKRTLRP